MSTVTQLDKFPLAGTKNGAIIISKVTEPYGAKSNDVISIGIALNGKDVEWKSHIPYDNIDQVIEALKEAKKTK